MSKIICDICGTSYPETATQCPICGCIRPGDVQRVTNEVKSDGTVSTGYTYVKGGRFSKANVKKRTQAQAYSAAETKEKSPKAPKTPKTTKPQKENKNGEEKGKNNIGLVITAVVLLLAIIGVVIYISVQFFMPSDKNQGEATGSGNQSLVPIPCVELNLDTDAILFEQLGDARLLTVSVKPYDTTDIIRFKSMDESIISVSEVGKVTAVAEGTTKIVVTCGTLTKECTVTCQLPEDSTPGATEDTTVPPESGVPDEDFHLLYEDITFSRVGEEANMYGGKIDRTLITWTSDDESIVTFVGGKAVAVAPGMTNVHAEYMGVKDSCIIRCVFQEGTGVEGSGGNISEDGGGSGNVTPTTPDSGSGNTSGSYAGTVQNTEAVNVRNGPGLSFEKVNVLQRGTEVTVTEEQTGAEGMRWGKTSYGWICLDYIVKSN